MESDPPAAALLTGMQTAEHPDQMAHSVPPLCPPINCLPPPAAALAAIPDAVSSTATWYPKPGLSMHLFILRAVGDPSAQALSAAPALPDQPADQLRLSRAHPTAPLSSDNILSTSLRIEWH